MFKQIENIDGKVTNLFMLKFESLDRVYEDNLNLQKNYLDKQVLKFSRSRSVKVAKMERKRKDLEFIEDQNRFVDLVWLESDKNQQIAYVKQLGTKMLDKSEIGAPCFFSFKQKLLKIGVIEELEYQQVEIQQMKFNKKCLPSNIKVAKQWFNINKVISKNFNVKSDVYHIEFMDAQNQRIINELNLFFSKRSIIDVIDQQQYVVPTI